MPEITRFYGIVIKMFWADHPPPHFHAEYGGHRAAIRIGSGAVLHGGLPPRALRMVRQWESMHRAELASNWENGRRPARFTAIDPLP